MLSNIISNHLEYYLKIVCMTLLSSHIGRCKHTTSQSPTGNCNAVPQKTSNVVSDRGCKLHSSSKKSKLSEHGRTAANKSLNSAQETRIIQNSAMTTQTSLERILWFQFFFFSVYVLSSSRVFSCSISIPLPSCSAIFQSMTKNFLHWPTWTVFIPSNVHKIRQIWLVPVFQPVGSFQIISRPSITL